MNNIKIGYIIKQLYTFNNAFSMPPNREEMVVNGLASKTSEEKLKEVRDLFKTKRFNRLNVMYCFYFIPMNTAKHKLVVFETSEQAQEYLKFVVDNAIRSSYYISRCYYKVVGNRNIYLSQVKPDKNEFLANLR